MASLSFPELRRALQALSSVYVERRGRLAEGAALETAGKRSAFALYYGPLHFLLVREIVRALGPTSLAPRRILDLGCGTGAAGGAWALACGQASVEAVDRSGWAVAEARWTLSRLGLRARVLKGEAARAPLPRPPAGVVAAYTLNELDPPKRDGLRPRLLEAGRAGTRVLIVEPLSRRVSPWWPAWAEAFRAAGGREDEWRFRIELPQTLRLLGKATGLDNRELSGRSLFLASG